MILPPYPPYLFLLIVPTALCIYFWLAKEVVKANNKILKQ